MEKCASDIQAWFSAIDRGKLSNIQKLLKNLDNIDFESNCIINDVEHFNVTGLILAAHVGNKDIVRWFLINNANVNATTHLGWQPVHFAAKRGHVATVDVLVSSGAILDNRTHDGETPIELAVLSHMWDTVRKLIQLGAKFDDANEALFNQYAPRSFLSMELMGKRKLTRQAPASPKLERDFSNNTFTELQIKGSGSISADQIPTDLHSQSLMSQLRYQGVGYDIELTRRKRDLVLRLQNLPLPFPQKNSVQFNQLVKLITSSNTSLTFRVTAAHDAISIVPLPESLKIKSNKPGKRNASLSLKGSADPYLRLLETSICERHCPEEVACLMSQLACRLIMINGSSTTIFTEEYDSETSEQNASKMETSITLKLSYLTRLVRKLITKTNVQYRSGVLSHMSRILIDISTTTVAAKQEFNETNLCSSSNVNLLLTQLVVLTESLDQATNVSRLTRFISLVSNFLSQSISNSENYALEYAERFTVLSDILVGWCVDSVSHSRGVDVRVLFKEIIHGLGSWWFQLSVKEENKQISTEPYLELSNSACEMLGHLIEDADGCLQKAVTDYRQVYSILTHRRGGPPPKPPISSDVTQNLICAHLFLSVLSKICIGIKKHAVNELKNDYLNFPPFLKSDWVSRLINILQNLDGLSVMAAGNLKMPPLAPRTYVPISYSLPLLTYSDMLSNAHHLLAFTVCTLKYGGDALRQKVIFILNRATEATVLKPSSEHIKTLCQLTYTLMQQDIKGSTTLILNTFKTIFGHESFFHQLKTSNTGSPKVFKLLMKLCQCNLLQQTGCDMPNVILNMCFSDIQLAVVNLVDTSKSCEVESELLFLFSLSLFFSISKIKPKANIPSNYCQLLTVLVDLQKRFTFLNFLSERVRLALLAALTSTLIHCLDDSSKQSMLYILKQIFEKTTCNYQEVKLTVNLVNKLVSLDIFPKKIHLAFFLSKYLCNLLNNSESPVRVNNGRLLRDAVGCLIQLSQYMFSSRKLVKRVRKLSSICMNHPIPIIQAAGTDLLLALGTSNTQDTFFMNENEYSKTKSLFMHWFNSNSPELSTPLLTSASINSSVNRPFNVLRSQGSFPSLPAVVGMLGILTRGAPYVSLNNASRLDILSEPSDWLRRLACMVSPIPCDSSQHDWYSLDCSPLTIVIWFTCWSMVDYKLKVAPWASPVKTFLSIEALIHSLLSQLTQTNSLQPAPELESFVKLSSSALARQSLQHRIRQSSFTLLFVQTLEKMITNAIDGFATSIPAALPAARTFFKANQITCHQWFNRVRGPFACLMGWMSPLASGNESAAAVTWNLYNLLYQVVEFIQQDQTQWLSKLSKFGDSEQIFLCLIQSLYTLGASEELDLLHSFLERAIKIPKTAVNTVHPFGWVHGLANICRGNLDQGFANLSAFIDAADSFGKPTTKTTQIDQTKNFPEFGAMSQRFVHHLVVHCRLLVGNAQPMKTLLDPMVNETMCTNRGDFVANRKSDDAKKQEASQLPIRLPSVSRQRLNALQKLSQWDDNNNNNDEQEIPLQCSNSTELIERLENQLLLLPTDDSKSIFLLQEITATVRQTFCALVAQHHIQTSSNPKYLPLESSLLDIVSEAEAVLGGGILTPTSNSVSLANWISLASPNNQLRTSTVLRACESLLLRRHTRQGVVDSPIGQSKQIAAQMLCNEARTLNLTNLNSLQRSTDFLALVQATNQRSQLASIDRLRMIRCLGSLLWVRSSIATGSASFTDKVVAMNCLAQGLKKSVVETMQDREKHARHCLLNASVALQLFNFLETSSTITTNKSEKLTTFCEEVFLATSVTEINSDHSLTEMQSQMVNLVQHLIFFSELAAAPWVDGCPLVPPSPEEDNEIDRDIAEKVDMVEGSRGKLPRTTIHDLLSKTSPSELSMRLLMFATRLSPTNASAAAWLQMANWCYTRGQNEVNTKKASAKRVLVTSLEMDDGDSAQLSSALTIKERDTLSQLLAKKENVRADEQQRERIMTRLLARMYTFLDKKKKNRSEEKGEEKEDEVRHFPLSMEKFCPDDLNVVPVNNELRQAFSEHLATIHGNEEEEEEKPTASEYEALVTVCAPIASALNARLYTLHTFAAQAYVTYLTVAGQLINGLGTTAVANSSDSEAAILPAESIHPIEPMTATLRLLCLLNEPCRSLRTLLKNLMVYGSDSEEPLARGDVAGGFQSAALSSQSGPVVWASCLPQLLVRLGHPDPAVRQCLIDLLHLLIKMTSQMNISSNDSGRALAARLVFPAIVGSKGIDSVESDHRAQSHSEIVSALRTTGGSSMVDQVLVFVIEARRLTILWEELWAGALNQHMDELSKKTNSLEQDLKRTALNMSTAETADQLEPSKNNVNHQDSIRKLKYRVLLMPTFTVFDQLIRLTLAVAPQTSHEAWFQSTFKGYIEETLISLNQLCESPDGLNTPASLLQQLIVRFQITTQPLSTRSSNTNLRILHLTQVSPRMANFADKSFVPLPGRSYLSLSRVGLRISIYPTKTRPKRIVFWGENGCAYPYLLKCLEDLRLDDRVVQLMRLTNIASRSRDRQTSSSTTLRTYSVTPLGPKAGLIQIVQGAMPLFTLYKRWQQRQVAAADDVATKIVSVPKPSDLFYSRLKENMPADISFSPNARSTWPMATLHKVLTSLEGETSPDLLTRELWAASPSMSTWWGVSHTFALSLGFTSAFGYLIGLGDRHLDNLLVDLTTGRLIHIDFNVCFDEGRNLRVPELVPFRLTRILRHPLGPIAFQVLGNPPPPVDVDNTVNFGTFGQSFCSALETFREIGELIMIQMQSFVLDPLMDWMRSRQSETNFDLHYLAAYRGGCVEVDTETIDSTSKKKLTKQHRLRERMFAELQRNAGLVAARFVELGGKDRFSGVCEQLYSSIRVLETKLETWKLVKQEKAKTECLTLRLSVLKSTSFRLNSLPGLEERVQAQTEAKIQLTDANNQLHNYLKCTEENVARKSHILSHWFASGFLQLPQSDLVSSLVTDLSTFYSIARSYLVPDDCELNASSPAWFAKTKYVLSTLTSILNQPDVDEVASLESMFLSTDPFHVEHINNELFDSLKLCHQSSESHSRLLRAQNFLPTNQDDTLDSLIGQAEGNLRVFLQKQGLFGPPAFKWALVKYVYEWTKSLACLEVLPNLSETESSLVTINRLDQLHQHISVLAVAFAPLDASQPEWETNPIPFQAGMEADAQSEIAFLFGIQQFVTCLFDLRDNLFNLLLPELEDVLMEAPSEGGLVDTIARLLLEEVDASRLQARVGELLSEAQESRFSHIFLALHLALTNATALMEEISGRMSNCPITAVAWVCVDFVSQAVTTLQNRASNLGATSLWGWRHPSGEPVNYTWADEVYTPGLAAIISLSEMLRCHWSAVRLGDLPPGTADPIDWDEKPLRPLELYLGRLMNRLAVNSQAILASSRLLLALLEESGISVRNALFELERMNQQPQSQLVSTDRLVQSAEFYAMNMQPPHVQTLAGVTGSLLANLFCRTAAHTQRNAGLKAIFYADEHVKRLSIYQKVFSWMHMGDSSPDEEQTEAEGPPDSIHQMIQRIYKSVQMARSAITKTECIGLEEAEEICALGEAVFEAERIRLRGASPNDELFPLLRHRDLSWEKYVEAKKNLSPLDIELLQMKEEYSLEWPTSQWCHAYVLMSGKPVPLIECLEQELATSKTSLSTARSTLDATSIALVSLEAKQGAIGAACEEGRDTQPCPEQQSVAGKMGRRSKGRKSVGSKVQRPAGVVDSSPDIVLLSNLRHALSSFQRAFLFDLRPHIKPMARLEHLLAKIDPSRMLTVWSQWLKEQQIWSEVSLQLLKNFNNLLAQLSADSSSAESLFDAAENLSTDCWRLRSQLTPSLLTGVPRGVFATLRMSEDGLADPKLSKILMEIGLVDEMADSKEIATYEELSCHSLQANACSELLPPQAFTALRHLQDRLHGRDSLLAYGIVTKDSVMKRDDHGKNLEEMTPAAQTDTCIRAAVDSDRLAAMFEGWTAWV